MRGRVWTISTAISASRIVLIFPIGFFLLTGDQTSRLLAAGLVLVGVATDFLDGYLARRWHEVSELGKIVDPLADKISVGAIAVLLVVLGDLPLWYLVIVLVRDALILAGGIIIQRKKKVITQSNWPGKIAVTAIALVLFLSIIQAESIEWLRQLSLWGSLFFMILSLILYANRLTVGIKADKPNIV